MSGGYNDNVIALGEGIPLPTDISTQSSGFGRFTVNGSYGWALTPKDTLTVGYGFQSDIYEGPLASLVSAGVQSILDCGQPRLVT